MGTQIRTESKLRVPQNGKRKFALPNVVNTDMFGISFFFLGQKKMDGTGKIGLAIKYFIYPSYDHIMTKNIYFLRFE